MGKLAKTCAVCVGGLSMMPPAIMAERHYSRLYDQNNPIANEWITKQGYKLKDENKLADFVSNTNTDYHAMGCHRSIFEGRNYGVLQKTPSSTKTQVGTTDTGRSKEFKFNKEDDPLIGCAIAYEKGKGSYEFELAIKQGEIGLVDRVSITSSSVKSQIIFYARNKDTSTPNFPYKYIFGGAREITPANKSDNYQVGSHTSGNWTNLKDICSSSCSKQPKHYLVWVGTKGTNGLMDNIGVKDENGKYVSFIKDISTNSTTFNYYAKTDKLEDNLAYTDTTYNLSVFADLEKTISKNKGKWQDIKEFCKSYETSKFGRVPLNDAIRLREYCYEKIPAPKPATAKP